MRRILTLVVVAIGLVAPASACGDRLTDDQRAARIAASGAGGRAASGGTGDAAGDPATTGDGTADGGLGTGAAGDPGTGGASGGASGSGGAGGSGPTVPVTAPAGGNGGATDVGVTATELRMGNVSLISGPVPGFGKTAVAATQAYFNKVNASGGLFGRKLVLLTSDDRLDAGRNRSEHERLSKEALGFVGSISGVDGGAVPVLKGTNVPDVALTIDRDRLTMANNFSPTPLDYGGSTRPYNYYRQTYGATKAAVVWAGQVTSRQAGQFFTNQLKGDGYDVVYTAEVAVTETNYTNVVQEMKRRGVQIVLAGLETTGFSRMRKAMDQQSFDSASLGPTIYGDKFLELTGDAAEGTRTDVNHLLFTDNDPAMAEFLSWFNRTSPGTKPDYFAVTAWASAELFVTAARAAGPQITRDKVIAQLKQINAFDAGGLISKVNPAGKKQSGCAVIAIVKGGKWVRESPASGFQCV